ncbi:MAG: hypothetical protein HRF49_09945 [bacterium]
MRSISILLAFLVLLSSPIKALAWGNVLAHPEINRQAFSLWVEIYGQGAHYVNSNGATSLVDTGGQWEGPEVLTSNPGYLSWTTGTGKSRKSFEDWLASAGYSADEPEIWMALCHFYDPKANPEIYLTDGVPDRYIVNPQIDALTWALHHPDNLFSWDKGLEYYALAFEGPEEEREENTAKAFRCLGETMHCIADMTQPCHVRNDAHGFYDPMENSVDDAIVRNHARNGSVESLVQISGLKIENLIHNIAYFTNSNFYSDETIYSQGAPTIMPRNGEPFYDRPQFSDFRWNKENQWYEKDFAGIGAVPMVKLVMETHAVTDDNGAIGYEERPEWHVVPEFADAYASVLIPIAVRGGAEAIEQFFPTIFINIKSEEEMGKQGTYLITGQIKHEVSADRAWKHEIKYSGPCLLVARRDGKETTIMGGNIIKGEIETIEVAPLPGDELFVQVEAGGRIFKSNPIKIESADEATYQLSAFHPNSFAIPDGFMCSGSISAPGLEIKSDTVDETLGHCVDARISGALPLDLEISLDVSGPMTSSTPYGESVDVKTLSPIRWVINKNTSDMFVNERVESQSGKFTLHLTEDNLVSCGAGFYLLSLKAYYDYNIHSEFYGADGQLSSSDDATFSFEALSLSVTVETESHPAIVFEEEG